MPGVWGSIPTTSLVPNTLESAFVLGKTRIVMGMASVAVSVVQPHLIRHYIVT
jgi:hypothetical protein